MKEETVYLVICKYNKSTFVENIYKTRNSAVKYIANKKKELTKYWEELHNEIDIVEWDGYLKICSKTSSDYEEYLIEEFPLYS